jgi:hypothetical protein
MGSFRWRNWDELNQWLEQKQCQWCGHIGLDFVGLGKRPNFSALICPDPDCGRHNGWMPAPFGEIQASPRRRAIRQHRLDEDRCHICLRTRTQAHAAGTDLQKHHLHDRARLVDSGAELDDLRYLSWICGTPCHSIITALRHAYGRDLTIEIEIPNDDDVGDVDQAAS